MSEILVGSAYGTLELRAQQFNDGVTAALGQLAKLRAEFAKGIPPLTLPGVGGSGGGGAPRLPSPGGAPVGQDFDKINRQFIALQQSAIRAAAATGDYDRALALTASEMNVAGEGTQRYNQLLVQQVSIQKQADKAAADSAKARQKEMDALRATLSPEAEGGGASFAEQFADSAKSSFLSIIGPAALAGAAIAGVKKALDFTEESYQLKAALDQTNRSIDVQLRSFRDVGQAQSEAAAFADRYKLTQQETQESIQASIPILRQSKQSLTDVESTLLRLSVLKPEQGISGAAFALAELQGGQSRSLETRFNIPIAKANELKKQIEAGGDAVVVLGKYLDSVGVGMDALNVRTEGASGKMNELKVATEKFQLALGGQAGGPGAALLDARIQVTQRATDLLSGNSTKIAAEDQAVFARQLGFSEGEARRFGDTYARIISQLVGGTVVTGQHVQALMREADADDRIADSTQRAANAAQYLGGAMDDVRKASAATSIYDTNKALAEQINKSQSATIETQHLSEVQRQIASIGKDVYGGLLTSAKGADILRQQYGFTADEADRLVRAQARIAGIQNVSKTEDTANAFRSLETGGGFQTQAQRQQAIQQQLATDKARQNQIISTGTALEKIAVRQQQYNDAVRQFGTNSAQAIDAQTNLIQAQEQADKKRVGGALSTADKLNNIAVTSGIDRAKIERENLDRLADQEQDFNLNRTRKQEDYEKQRRRLLAEGKVFEARQAAETFATEQRRAAEDFAIQRQRTLRNNAESLGDQGVRADLAATKAANKGRIGGAAGAPDLGGATPTLGPVQTSAARGSGARVIQVKIVGAVNLDGQKLGDLIYPHMQQTIEDGIVLDFQAAGIAAPPGGGQSSAVSGARP